MAEKRTYIGQMNRKIQVYRMTEVVQATGERKEVPELVCEPWAEMRDTSGSQMVEGAIMSVINRSYVMRRNPVIVAGGREMQVKDGAQTFVVHAMKEIARTHLELMVTAIENNS